MGDIKRVMLNTHAIPEEQIIEFFGKLNLLEGLFKSYCKPWAEHPEIKNKTTIKALLTFIVKDDYESGNLIVLLEFPLTILNQIGIINSPYINVQTVYEGTYIAQIKNG